MATDRISLGPTPAAEDCEQLGPNYDPTKARLECARFRDLIIATLGDPPMGARFKITSCAHDFGTYYDLEVLYDDNDPEAVAYAFRCESEAPETWDAVPAPAGVDDETGHLKCPW